MKLLLLLHAQHKAHIQLLFILNNSGLMLGPNFYMEKVKVIPYTSVRRGVPVGENTYPEPSA